MSAQDGKPLENFSRIVLGVCAMGKKANSQPMKEILNRLPSNLFEIVVFGEDTIFGKDVEDWPTCECLIAFYSNGFPLEKAEDYARLRKPFMLNDLFMQRVIMDRRRVYDLLEENGVAVAPHIYVNRDNPQACDELIEHEDYIEINGKVMRKPFVEKPVNADDHNIYIYYPMSVGGGSKRLFRKVGDRSSEFYPDVNEVRREGSYIYEQFMETQGVDVKVYTVGPYYAHAEARKSPVVDGKVQRNENGKEVRYPVLLSNDEKELTRKVCIMFRQTVCGFDLLRIQNGKPLVCDVNGWSFVKNSRKYYDDSAQSLKDIMLTATRSKTWSNSIPHFAAVEPMILDRDHDITQEIDSFDLNQHRQDGSLACRQVVPSASGLDMSFSPDDAGILTDGGLGSSFLRPDAPSPKGSPAPLAQELRCVIAIIRHGDRTPKQKMKIIVSSKPFLDYFHSLTDDPRRDIKVKSKLDLTRFLEITRSVIADIQNKLDSMPDPNSPIEGGGENVPAVVFQRSESAASPSNFNSTQADQEFLLKLFKIRDVLERWKITGINRKLQIKPRAWVISPTSLSSIRTPRNESVVAVNGSWMWDDLGVSQSTDIKKKKKKSKKKKSDDDDDEDDDSNLPPVSDDEFRASEVMLILKWGGDLTELGEHQAEELGKKFRRDLYPDPHGGGVLRLHSTFRHDLKIKASDEGRVMKTAASFAKGLLELEGDIIPIMVSLVECVSGGNTMLDSSGNEEVKADMERCKKSIHDALVVDNELTEDEVNQLVSAKQTSVRRALLRIGNPKAAMKRLHVLIGNIVQSLQAMVKECTGESAASILKGIKRYTQPSALTGPMLYGDERLILVLERWMKLYEDFYKPKKDLFDMSKLPDVYDAVRYDLQHNRMLRLPCMFDVYKLVKDFADCVVPQEYGVSVEDKRTIGGKVCCDLLNKIKKDLIVGLEDDKMDMRYLLDLSHADYLPINSLGRRVRTRLYFTSESHLHTVLNALRYSEEAKNNPFSIEGNKFLENVPELSYLTHIVIRLLEIREPVNKSDPNRFRVEIFFSPGTTFDPSILTDSAIDVHDSPLTRDSFSLASDGLLAGSPSDISCTSSERLHVVGRSMSCADLLACLDTAINVGQPDSCPMDGLNSCQSDSGVLNSSSSSNLLSNIPSSSPFPSNTVIRSRSTSIDESSKITVTTTIDNTKIIESLALEADSVDKIIDDSVNRIVGLQRLDISHPETSNLRRSLSRQSPLTIPDLSPTRIVDSNDGTDKPMVALEGDLVVTTSNFISDNIVNAGDDANDSLHGWLTTAGAKTDDTIPHYFQSIEKNKPLIEGDAKLPDFFTSVASNVIEPVSASTKPDTPSIDAMLNPKLIGYESDTSLVSTASKQHLMHPLKKKQHNSLKSHLPLLSKTNKTESASLSSTSKLEFSTAFRTVRSSSHRSSAQNCDSDDNLSDSALPRHSSEDFTHENRSRKLDDHPFTSLRHRKRKKRLVIKRSVSLNADDSDTDKSIDLTPVDAFPKPPSNLPKSILVHTILTLSGLVLFICMIFMWAMSGEYKAKQSSGKK